MFKQTFFLLLLFCIFNACNNGTATVPVVEKQEESKEIPVLFYKKLVGKIGDQISITMDLNKINDSTLDGRYFSDTYSSPRNIHGKIQSSGEITLKEYNENDMLSGEFIGKFTNPDIFEGTWKNSKSAQVLNFSLKVDTVNICKVAFENLISRNCIRADKNRQNASKNINTIDTVCSRISINYLKIISDNSTQANTVNAEIEKAICETKDRKFNSLNDYLNSIHEEGNINLLKITELGCAIVTNDKNIISLAITRYQNDGGLNPNYSCDYHNFDITTAKKISLDELFKPNFKEALNEIAGKIFARNSGLSASNTTPLKLNSNFAITNSGLLFLFNPNEIGTYAAASPEIFIPYKDISDLINPNGVLSRFISKPNI